MSEEALVGPELRRRLSISLLAGIPLFLAYEYGVAATAAAGDPLRNSSELLLSQLIELPGGGAGWRYLGLAIVLGFAGLRAALQRWPLGEGAIWSLLEGAGLGLVLGPLMMLLLGLLGWLPGEQLISGGAGGGPGIEYMALVVGGAVWEELLFRFVLYAAVLAVVASLAKPFVSEEGPPELLGEVLAVLLTSLAFAAAHLESVLSWLGKGGEAYDFDLFAWRAFAGVALAVIARTRGLGVAIWTHAVFNVGLALGSGPGVFLIEPR